MIVVTSDESDTLHTFLAAMADCGMSLDKFADAMAALPPVRERVKAEAIEAQGVPDDADVWCEYVAEMVGAYISEPVGSEKVKAIAGIIRRRMPQRFFASAPPAPQAKPQPILSSEIWNNDAIMEVNADAQLPYELIERFVRAVEAAHGIQGGAA